MEKDLEARSSTTSWSSEFEDILPPPENEEDANVGSICELATTVFPNQYTSRVIDNEGRYSLDFALTERANIPRPLNPSSIVDLMDSHEEGSRAAGPLSLATKPSILNNNHMFEEFLLITQKPGVTKPEIIFQYPGAKLGEGCSRRKAVLEFCFPTHNEPKRLKKRTSHEYLFDSSQYHWYIFTMNTSDAGVKYSKNWYAPNKDREIYYVVCISTFEKVEERGHQWIVPK